MKKFAAIICVALIAAMLGIAPAGAQPDPMPKLRVEPTSASEGDGFVRVTVRLDAPTDHDVRFFIRGSNGTAKKWSDYKRTIRRGVIPAGATSATARIPLRTDEIRESDEILWANVRGVRGAEVVTDRARVVLYDDDGANRRTRFDLDLLHVNDSHSHLEQSDIDLEIGGNEVNFEFGGFPRLVQAMTVLERRLGPDANVAKVHAGDAITGTLFYTLFEGEADAALMNEACFDVFALGNHEFDGGDAGLKTFLDFLNAGDCGTETLAANVKPAIGTPLAPNTARDYVKPFTVKRYGNTRVGFIGLDISQKTRVSSQPLDTTRFLDEVKTAQRYIDRLTARGIEHIVLVTHRTYDADLDLASMVRGVDVIVGGDSHTLLGDFDKYGLSSLGDYPTLARDASGNRVCVVQAWEYTHILGQVNVGFDRRGRVTGCEGTPHLLLGDVLDNNGTPRRDIRAAVAADPQLGQWGERPKARRVLDRFAREVDVLAAEVIGTASEDICQARFPNDGRSLLCSDTDLPQGGEIQQLVTEAFLARAFRAEVALQNSGGVRIDIPAGDVTIAAAYELLPFANTLVELEMTGQEILTALEQGLSNVLEANGSTGAFPYGAGIRWDLDASAALGSRFTNVEIRVKGTDTWAPVGLADTYIVVANSFMASGGDGYQVLDDVVADGRSVDTLLDYAQSFIDWVVEDQGGTIAKPTEFSLKSYVPAPAT